MLRYVKTRLQQSNGRHAGDRPAPRRRKHDEPRLLELLQSTALFDPRWYLLVNPDVAHAGIDPYVHFLRHGAAEGRATSAFFDATFYLNQFPEEKRPAVPLLHYLESDWSEQKDPSPYFDQRWYLARNAITPEDAPTPADHYLAQRPPYLNDPSPAFSNAQYLRQHPDVAESRLNPLLHYLQSGKSEGRRIIAPARYRIRPAEKRLDGADVLVFAAFCPDGTLSELQREMIRTYRRDGFFVVTVINSGNLNRASDPRPASEADIVIVRENLGFDFGAWSEAIGAVGGLPSLCRSVSFTNDSVIPLPRGDRKSLRALVRQHRDGVVFMTLNDEFRPHEQSYFFTVTEASLRTGALDVLGRFASFEVKDELIHGAELFLGETFRREGFRTHVLFRRVGRRNPTIHHWQELIEAGFPFLKVMLFTSGLEHPSSPKVRAVLGEKVARAACDHLAARGRQAAPRLEPASALPVPAIGGGGLMGPVGELQAYNYPPGQNPAILVPFGEDRCASAAAGSAGPPARGRILAVVHCFYPDIAETILKKVEDLGLDPLVICTTDTVEKQARLTGFLAGTTLRSKVLVTPNRGRDVAPFLIEGKRFLDGHDYVLHLHTKKSPHSSVYAGWGDFLFENLVGSPAVARSVLRLLAEGPFGLVYSRHFHAVEGLRNWGFDYDKASTLLKTIGVDLSVDRILEFPTSTMFWARADAIRPLFDLPLTYDNFDTEAGQIDGTLAHAIERSLLYVCEHQGYEHTMVAVRRYRDSDQIVEIERPGDLAALEIPKPRLMQSFGRQSRFHAEIGDVYPVHVTRSSSGRSRLNILAPTLEPAQIYGGISSALAVGRRLYAAFGPDADLRIIVTSEGVSHRGLDEAVKRFRREVLKVWPVADMNVPTVVPLYEQKGCPLSLRADDVFLATAWWTADLAYRLQRAQEDIFGASRKVLYLIQDYESRFYGWSARSVLAKDTYRSGDDTIAIFNSEELANFMTERFDFADAWHLPYEIDGAIAAARKSVPKENLVLVYGRRQATRNLFPMILEGLRMWQAADPHGRSRTKIVFAGEDFDDALVADLANARVAGKLSLEAYADVLSRAAVGVSLMESPHPSYPPLEMASSGCITVTNNYPCKDMSLRSGNIIALDAISPRSVCEAVTRAFQRAPVGRTWSPERIRPVPTSVPVFDEHAVAAQVRGVVPAPAAGPAAERSRVDEPSIP